VLQSELIYACKTRGKANKDTENIRTGSVTGVLQKGYIRITGVFKGYYRCVTGVHTVGALPTLLSSPSAMVRVYLLRDAVRCCHGVV
jgi:hypothetical protein